MGNKLSTCDSCAQSCCSGDAESRKQAKKRFMNSKENRPEKMRLQSETTDNTFENEPSNEHSQHIYSYCMDAKTMELLSQISFESNNNDALNEVTDIAAPQMIDPSVSNASNLSNLSTTAFASTTLREDTTTSFELHDLERNVTSSRVKKMSHFSDVNELEQIMKEQYSIPDQTDDNMDEKDDMDNLDSCDSSESSESSLSDNEKLEIEHRKSLTLTSLNKNKIISLKPTVVKSKSLQTNSKKPSLYRDKTSSSWDEQHIDTLADDMQKQLLTLRNHASEPIPQSNVSFLKPKSKTKTKNKNKAYKIVVDNTDMDIINDTEEVEPNMAYMNSNSSVSLDVNVETNLFRSKSADKWDVDDIDATKGEMKRHMMNLMLMHQESNKKGNVDTVADEFNDL